MAFEITSAIDHGFIDAISYDEIYKEIKSGRLITFLKEKLGDAIVLSHLKGNPGQERCFIEVMQRIANVAVGSDFGIEKHGLCLLLAFCIEAIQSKQWDGEREAKKQR